MRKVHSNQSELTDYPGPIGLHPVSKFSYKGSTWRRIQVKVPLVVFFITKTGSGWPGNESGLLRTWNARVKVPFLECEVVAEFNVFLATDFDHHTNCNGNWWIIILRIGHSLNIWRHTSRVFILPDKDRGPVLNGRSYSQSRLKWHPLFLGWYVVNVNVDEHSTQGKKTEKKPHSNNLIVTTPILIVTWNAKLVTYFAKL